MLNINPFRQKPGCCGPASLKMVLDFFGYAFGDLSVYGRIVEAINKTTPVLAHKMISAGQSSRMRTNEEGFIVRLTGFQLLAGRGPRRIDWRMNWSCRGLMKGLTARRVDWPGA